VKRAVGFLLLLGACKVGPDYVPPQVEAPPSFSQAVSAELDADARWWKSFSDPVLDELVEVALTSNRDLLAAAQRVREARAVIDIESDRNYPTVDGRVGYVRRKPSTAVAGGQFLPSDPASVHTVGFDARWEIDLFGHNARAIEAVEAGYGSALEDARGVLQRLVAEVARNYVELRGVERELVVLRESLAAQEDAAELVGTRVDAGIATELDAARVAGLLATTRSQVPELERARAARVHALAVLLGEFPAVCSARISFHGKLPAPPAGIPIGSPVDLLRRRPDVRRTERELARAAAMTAAATAELYPRLSIGALFGWESQYIDDMFSHPARSFTVGPSLAGPIFRRRIIEAGIEVRTSQQEQALLAHEQAFVGAMRDVEDALVAVARTSQRVVALEEALRAERRAHELATELYEAGLSDYLTVLDVQRSVLSAESELARGRTDRVVAAVALYKALGGGWEFEVEVPALEPVLGAPTSD
jgi:NodT family efflux transporter outer membrane factor (OMF) lipoprotein